MTGSRRSAEPHDLMERKRPFGALQDAGREPS